MYKTRALAATASIIVLAAAPFLAGCGGSSKPASPPPAPVPVAVQQLPSAKDIAAQLHGTKFTQKDVGNGRMLWGMTDGGTFWVGGTKYAINTFTTKDARDRWLKVSKQIGVNPKWMTPTAVIYPSLFPGR